MTESDPPAPIEPYIAMLCEAVATTCREAGLALPHLVLEPGRSLVAPAAVALYTVGARKEIPGVRTYVSVDGGMADNIRPALYGAQYTALHIANRQIAESQIAALHAALQSRSTKSSPSPASSANQATSSSVISSCPGWLQAICWRSRWPARTRLRCPATTI